MQTYNLERTSGISLLCDNILGVNEDIFLVSSLNKNGKAREFKISNDRIISKMTKQETEMLFMQRSLQTSLGMEFDDLIGPLNFITVQRETLLEFIFPYSHGTILVMCNLGVVPNFLAKKISYLIRDFEWQVTNSICD